MKALRIVLPVLIVSAGVVVAEDYPELVQGMKATDQAAGALRKMDQKVGPQALRAAETLGTVYEGMIQFFRQQGDPKMVKVAEDGKAASTILAKAAFAKDAQAADDAFKTISGTCRTCHDVYRVRGTDGKFHFKQPGEKR